MGDTIVNLWNWGSYLVRIGVLGGIFKLLFPNIAFLRTLRFLKPFGRVKALFASKVVVKTVSEAIAQMGPVLSLVGFMILLFSIMGKTFQYFGMFPSTSNPHDQVYVLSVEMEQCCTDVERYGL